MGAGKSTYRTVRVFRTTSLIRLSHGLIDLWCRSHPVAPKAITLDIDDTADTVHGHQQLSLFNAHYDERCFLPIHVYDAASGHCVLTILRPGKTPDGREVRGHIRRLAHRIRMHWPDTGITFRGDSHHGRKEVMNWCEQNDVGYIFGFAPKNGGSQRTGIGMQVLPDCTWPGGQAQFGLVPTNGGSQRTGWGCTYCPTAPGPLGPGARLVSQPLARSAHDQRASGDD